MSPKGFEIMLLPISSFSDAVWRSNCERREPSRFRQGLVGLAEKVSAKLMHVATSHQLTICSQCLGVCIVIFTGVLCLGKVLLLARVFRSRGGNLSKLCQFR